MAIASLSKFTVPLASNQSATSQGMLMPKLKYRFRVSFISFGTGGNGLNELTKQVIDVTRPTVQFVNQVIDVYNSKVNYAGKHTWNPMTLNLRDDANGNISKAVGAQLQKQFDFLEQSSAAAASNYKFQMLIEILDGQNGIDGSGFVLETWDIVGCYIQQANYQNLAYSDSAPATIALTIQMDNCTQFPIAQGVGQVVARTIGEFATGSAGLG